LYKGDGAGARYGFRYEAVINDSALDDDAFDDEERVLIFGADVDEESV
jgi:hypothetical protein